MAFWGHPAGLVAYAAAVMGKRTGHGQYAPLGTGERQPVAQDERLDCVVRFFFGADYGGNYWRCVFGLVVTGLAVTLPAGILYGIVVNPWHGAVLAVSGASKSVAYMIPWAVRRRLGLSYSTWWGEFLTGAFGWGIIGVTCL